MNAVTTRAPGLVCFNDPNLSIGRDKLKAGETMSPFKPAFVMERLLEVALSLGAITSITSQPFTPFTPDRFLIAHTPEYVTAFFQGTKPLCESNDVPWTPVLAQSVLYTNASLAAAQEFALLNPEKICFSPTSGFHHARPAAGFAYCSFSGQVISAVELYRKYGVAGAWIDLDAHFGNSIEDSREHVPDLNKAIPPGCNINPQGAGREYLRDLSEQLVLLKQRVLTGEISWIAFAQGVDSHHADDFVDETDMIAQGRLSTKEWMEANRMVYEWIAQLDQEIGKPIPLTIALFGGYRADDYETVRDLHVANLLTAMQVFDPTNPKWQFDLTVTNYPEGQDAKVDILSYPAPSK